MEDDLLDEVANGLRARKGQWKQIAAEVPDVSYSWIAQVGRGTYESAPTHNRLKAVAEWLRAHQPQRA